MKNLINFSILLKNYQFRGCETDEATDEYE